ncbi:MAG: sensor histidine kinase [Proteobacteria bacterium]|nr:sensor histidine kinase [Pseudomonadota bacterium]MBU1710970.1 sensor histidine kinase [Pseudomonadota bacterium]
MANSNNIPPDLEIIFCRVHQKRDDYKKYAFSPIKNDILKTFFDLAQEFDSLKDFYRICVAVPKDFLQVDSRLYLTDEAGVTLKLVCDSIEGLSPAGSKVPDYIRLASSSYQDSDSYIVPVFRKSAHAEDITPLLPGKNHVLGMFEIFPQSRLTEADRLFFEKYTGRIGYNLHNRIVGHQNIRHLKFINNLVRDIDHNVIVPNMYFRHIFNQLKKRILDLENLGILIHAFKEDQGVSGPLCDKVAAEVEFLRRNLAENYNELMGHHATISLFLESLFRREHFEEGHLVLRSKKCLIEKEIIAPQLEYYCKRFHSRGIEVEKPKDMIGEEIPLNADVGLLAQVYSNLFSNAVKYTEEIIREHGLSRKSVAYGREFMADYFGPGKNGIKFNVFSTGPHLRESDAKMIYSEGFRGMGSHGTPGSGHGLSFVKHVIEIHGGVVGYEPTEEGNNFFFILPLGIDRQSIPDLEQLG